ncbi:meprin A subunit beta-like [Plectropomus leopardus]|uniref:meprin A subunit beta-like n=1 Tax=Plectropomus leopardus TaxID=160734 RepID=UPI001C4C8CD7|nr:meprin A subunit beta-like [Plectropomus leopardus]
MKALVFLFVNLAVSSAFTQKPIRDIVDIGEDKDIIEANKDSMTDDILEKPDTLRSAIVNENRLWTSPVPYVLENDLELNAKGVILKAFDQFRLKSCIDFKPRDSEEYYISVQKKGGCYSYIGRVSSTGQVLSIGRYCDELSTVEHEFLHALGFHHEQSRYDRDNYVTIAFENIIAGMEFNFREVSKDYSTTQGVPYDYLSVMHYGKNAFSNGNGSTIITKDPRFQDIIGQRREMSPSDVLELNLLYKCNSSIAFKMHCSFSDGTMCQMNGCSKSGRGWEMVKAALGGPRTDHTTLPNGNGDHGHGAAYFMHASTAKGKEGDSARLETHTMTPNRDCHVQCLQFYYYNSGSPTDQLNIWIREFQDEWDAKGTRRLMAQITGYLTTHWKLQHVSLDATKPFRVEFEVRKGAGDSSGGFSIDDINLSEIECPHVTMQINDFENLLNTSKYGYTLYSSRQYSRGGYAYAVGAVLYKTYFGLFVQLLSGENDDKLKWPCPQRQVTFEMLDQNPKIQLQMSKQRSITSDLSRFSDGTFRWDNPRKTGTPYVDENGETIYAGPLLGRRFFAYAKEMKTHDFLKGGSAVFVFSFQDLTPVVNGSTLPCPKVSPVKSPNHPKDHDEGPCSTRIVPTTPPATTTSQPQTTDDDSVFGFSAGLACSPVLILLLALMLLIP